MADTYVDKEFVLDGHLLLTGRAAIAWEAIETAWQEVIQLSEGDSLQIKNMLAASQAFEALEVDAELRMRAGMLRHLIAELCELRVKAK